MLSFESINESQLTEILKHHKDLKLSINESIVKFKTSIPEVDFTSPQEVRPTPIALAPESLAQIIINSGDDLKGKYIRLVLTVYALGGIIQYTSIDSDNYEAHIIWPND